MESKNIVKNSTLDSDRRGENKSLGWVGGMKKSKNYKGGSEGDLPFDKGKQRWRLSNFDYPKK